jgi:hypothetical protein
MTYRSQAEAVLERLTWRAPGGGNRPGAAGLPTVQTTLSVVSST